MSALYLVLSYVCEGTFYISVSLFLLFGLAYIFSYIRMMFGWAVGDFSGTIFIFVNQARLWLAAGSTVVSYIGWMVFSILSSSK